MKRHTQIIVRLLRFCSVPVLPGKAMLFVLLLLLQQSVNGQVQVLHPLEQSVHPFISRELYKNSVGALETKGSTGALGWEPNRTIIEDLMAGSISEPGILHVWGPVYYGGSRFTIKVTAPDGYFSTFPAGETVLRETFTFKVYAPDDSFQTGPPIYENDSVCLMMTGGTPEVFVDLDLDSVLYPYIPITGRFNLDTLNDSLLYVTHLMERIEEAYRNGADSILVDTAMIGLDSASYLADSASYALRGGAPGTSLYQSRLVNFTLSVNPGQSYAYAGLNTSLLRLTAGVGISVVITPSVLWPRFCLTPFNTAGVVLDNPVKFNWTDCPHPNYEIQVLRLYNTDTSLHSDSSIIKAKVDWSQALDLETNNGDRSLRLTLAEGTGYYVWRVRWILDTYPNTIGDNRNWGPWTGTGPFVNGATVNVTAGMLNNYLFFYKQFDDTLNWIYHRQFVEGEVEHGSQLRIGEKTTFANYLLMPSQEQVRAQQADTILASQTIPDYSGRPGVQTLTAPVNKHGFSYERDYIKNRAGNLYTAEDFDLQSNVLLPGVVGGGSKLFKYYSSLNPDVQIPICDSIPFSRTLNYNDPIGRPRETASPGQTHSFGNDHTVLNYYSSTATTELIRLFGDEAPASESVLKTYTIDPNHVFNVTYTDEITGKVLATCLSAPQSSLLDTIQSNVFTVRDTVKAKTVYPAPPQNKIIETKTYTFAIPTKLSYVYSLLPNIYGDTCLGLCASCDYVVRINGYNVDDTVPAHAFTRDVIISPGVDSTGMPCTSVQYIDSTDYGIVPLGAPAGTGPSTILQPGTYVVSAAILLGNSNPSTGVPYIVEADSTLMRKLRLIMWSGLGSVAGGNSGLTLTAMQGYINAQDMDGLLAYTGADTSQPYFTFKVGCDTLRLPTAHCPKHSCAVIDFAQYMVSELAAYDASHGSSTYSGITNISGTTHADNLFLLASDAEFNTVISNMLADGYDCDTLWNAWVQTVSWYANVQHAAHPATLVPGADRSDWWENFMGRVGYKHPLLVRAASQLGSPGTDVTTKPYRYFPYNSGSNGSAETTFCYLYENSVGLTGGTTPYTTWIALIENFTTYQPSDAFHMYNFYKSVKPSSPAFVPGIAGGTGGGLGTPPSLPGTVAVMMHNCYTACEDRRTNLVDLLALEFMKSGVYVPGHTYMSWYPHPATDTMTVFGLYCRVNSLISHCKEGCTLTPNSSGVIPPSQVLAYQQSMTYGISVQASMVDSPTCTDKIICTDTTVHLVDTLFYNCSTQGVPRCDTLFINRDSTYCNVTGVDTGYHAVYGNDTSYPANDMVLDWIMYRYNYIYDSLRNCGYVGSYVWIPGNDPGVPSFGPTTFTCPGLFDINPACPRGIITYDTVRSVDDTCTTQGFKVHRRSTRTRFVNGILRMRVDVELDAGGSGLATGDSIVIIETLPSAGTVIPGSSSGIVGGSSIRKVLYGPLSAGTVQDLTYDVRMPAINNTDVVFGNTVTLYKNLLSPSACATSPDTVTAVNCMRAFYRRPCDNHMSPMDCYLCYVPMGCHAGVCMKYTPPGTVPPGTNTPTDSFHVVTCAELVCNNFTSTLLQQLVNIYDNHSDKLLYAYEKVCNDPEQVKDMFVNKYDLNQYQYTLYYYDRATNLVRTVQPAGVRDTATGRYGAPDHYDVTEYDYNTLGQKLREKTPDGGETRYWYDKRGKVRLSQNDHQLLTRSYSYIMYDELARVVATGQISGYPSYPALVDTADLYDPGFPLFTGTAYPDSFITITIYSDPFPLPLPNWGMYTTQQNLRNRISWTLTDRDGHNLGVDDDETWTMYSYDVHGNVTEKIQYVGGESDAVIQRYQYDLVSNKVVRVSQNKLHSSTGLTLGAGGTPWFEDYVAQWYSYDGDKRLVKVQSSYKPNTWRTEAEYQYYLHGPLRRTLLSNNIATLPTGTVSTWGQGIDYTYTIQGWLKAINHSHINNLVNAPDPGKDGPFTLPIHLNVGKDLFGMVLHYYNGDFRHPGSPFIPANALNLPRPSDTINLGGGNLYDGNIARWQQMVNPIGTSLRYQEPVGYTYRYDQLNRITKSRFWDYSLSISPFIPLSWRRLITPNTVPNPNDELFSYDKNGNIQHLTRYAANSSGGGVLSLDDLYYHYYLDASFNQTNRLSNIEDAFGPTHTPLEDYYYGNYTWQKNGQLMQENGPNDNTRVKWTPDDKVDSVLKYHVSTGAFLGGHAYLYDAIGNQVRDLVLVPNGSGHPEATDTSFKIYDANHQMLAQYHMQNSSTPTIDRMWCMERYIYGSERISTWKDINQVISSPLFPYMAGVTGSSYFQEYELHDHLGNVRATFGKGGPATYIPMVGVVLTGLIPATNYYNYYAFGSYQPYRVSAANNVSFGYNGQEKKDDYHGKGNHNHAFFGELDTRIARRWNLDPKPDISMSPYAVFNNSPIWHNDILLDSAGKTPWWYAIAYVFVKMGERMEENQRREMALPPQERAINNVMTFLTDFALTNTPGMNEAGTEEGSVAKTAKSEAKILPSIARRVAKVITGNDVVKKARSLNIYSNSKALVPGSTGVQLVEGYLAEMRAGTFNRGAAGFVDKTGRTVLTDGNHAMNAAIKYSLENNGDMKYINMLIEKGNFTKGVDLSTYGVKVRDLPTLK